MWPLPRIQVYQSISKCRPHHRGGCYGIWDLGFEGLKILGFGTWGVKLFGIWDLGKIFGIWDLRLINLNILSEIHILFIYVTLDIG